MLTPASRTVVRAVLVAFAAASVGLAGCGNPHDSSIVYKKLTPEEFAKLPPEEQETPEVQENMGAAWKDPNTPEGATNPKRGPKSKRTAPPRKAS